MKDGISLSVYFYLFSSGAFEFKFDRLVPNWQFSFSATRTLAKDGKVEGSRKETTEGMEEIIASNKDCRKTMTIMMTKQRCQGWCQNKDNDIMMTKQ